jgi:hypothetical protein
MIYTERKQESLFEIYEAISKLENPLVFTYEK